jgi:transposase
MDIHKNARLTVHGRERIARQVMSGQTPKAAAIAVGVCPRTIRKWVARYRAERLAGLRDRSSRPRRLRRPTPQEIVKKIEQLRRQLWTGKQIAAEVGVSPATVSRVLRRLGLNKLSALEPEPVRRYERENPGELIHIDIKKLGRIGGVGHRITGRRTGVVNRHLGIGWEFVHVCIDDASRIAFSRVMIDERKESAVAFLEAAVAYYASLGVTVERVMTDNGSCYLSLEPSAKPARGSASSTFSVGTGSWTWTVRIEHNEVRSVMRIPISSIGRGTTKPSNGRRFPLEPVELDGGPGKVQQSGPMVRIS